MTVALDWLPETAFFYLLLFARVGAFLMLVPALGEDTIPQRMRLSFALALTLVMGFSWLQEWLGATSGFLENLFGWAIGLTSAWIPVYLLLMQKRVYGQGWLMTLLKFAALGFLYSILLGFGLLAALLVGLLTL